MTTRVNYRMVDGSPINILDFGADPTGTQDSTNAIQLALDAGLVVDFPSGTYLISQRLLIRAGHRIKGNAVIKIADGNYSGNFWMMTNTTKSVPYDYDPGIPQAANIRIEGLTFDGNASGASTTGNIGAIFFDQVDFSTIDKVSIRSINQGSGGAPGIRFYYSNKCVVSECNIQNTDRQGVQNYESDIVVKDCYISNSKEREPILTSTQNPKQYRPGRTDIIRCNLLNTVTTNGSHVVRFSGESSGSVRDCKITGTTSLNGIYITFGEEHNVEIQGNTIKNCNYGVLSETTGLKYLKLENNLYESCINGFRHVAGNPGGVIKIMGDVYKVTTQPIYCAFAENVMVSNNFIEGGTSPCFFGDYDHLLFIDNLITDMTSASQVVNANGSTQETPSIISGNTAFNNTANIIRHDGNAIVSTNSCRTIGSGVHPVYLNDRYLWTDIDTVYVSSGTDFPANNTDGIIVGTQS